MLNAHEQIEARFQTELMNTVRDIGKCKNFIVLLIKLLTFVKFQ